MRVIFEWFVDTVKRRRALDEGKELPPVEPSWPVRIVFGIAFMLLGAMLKDCHY